MRRISSTRSRVRIGAAALLGMGMVAAGCGSSSSSPAAGGGASTNKASAPGVTAKTIKIGFITSATGNAASTFADSATGAKAYFAAVNKAGGVDGRQLQLVVRDDQSSTTGDLTATEDLINQGVFAIIQDSPYAFGGYKAAQKAGVPVVGGGFDGPEWGTQPNTNMFSFLGSMDPVHSELQASVPAVPLFKSLGVSNVGGAAYGDSPSSTSSIKDMATALADGGLKMGYQNLSLPFGTTDVTSLVLALKQSNVDMAVCSCVQSTVIALATGLKQGGVNAKMLSLASADSSLFADPTAAQAAQGLIYESFYPPLDSNNAASKTMEDNLKAADPSYQVGTYPSYGIAVAYLASSLLDKGLQVAGQNPTRASFITNLSKVTNFDANGLLPEPVSFTDFGHSQPSYCNFYVKVQGNTFVSLNGGKPFCAKVPSDL